MPVPLCFDKKITPILHCRHFQASFVCFPFFPGSRSCKLLKPVKVTSYLWSHFLLDTFCTSISSMVSKQTLQEKRSKRSNALTEYFLHFQTLRAKAAWLPGSRCEAFSREKALTRERLETLGIQEAFRLGGFGPFLGFKEIPLFCLFWSFFWRLFLFLFFVQGFDVCLSCFGDLEVCCFWMR